MSFLERMKCENLVNHHIKKGKLSLHDGTCSDVDLQPIPLGLQALGYAMHYRGIFDQWLYICGDQTSTSTICGM